MPAISARDVVQTALAEAAKKVVESPPNSNRTPYGKALGIDGVFWCGVFVWWVFWRCGFDLRKHGIPRPESTNAFDQAARAAGWKLIPASKADVGDIVFYDFGSVAPGDPPDDDDHVGIVVRAARGGTLEAAEGNTSPGDGGSQRNGGGVYRRTRSLSLARHVLRPPYAALTAAHSDEDDDMAIDLKALADEIVNGKHIEVVNSKGEKDQRSLADFVTAINSKANAAAKADQADSARDAQLLATVETMIKGRGTGTGVPVDPAVLLDALAERLKQ